MPQHDISIGVPEYRGPQALTLWKLMRMPFGRQWPAWQLPDQTTPERPSLPVIRDQLLARNASAEHTHVMHLTGHRMPVTYTDGNTFSIRGMARRKAGSADTIMHL